MPATTAQKQFLLVWMAFALLVAVGVAFVAGWLSWLSTADVPGSIITGGVAFGGTLTLAIAIIVLLRGR
ncbi:hypothetical protein GCM10022243_50510 [Saccharothrix violaceirubra]|uniref:Uncharacterized protein n=1 Tax=Saccharothrix violaceirubra TaxID=413306 RepID=A0A7W7SZ26_9PSEU|nr:hypothetical protein [Saccharothrix violaceirubra]MBB4963607.1 hypothetical protein [Saccharothrix violaceirubra]